MQCNATNSLPRHHHLTHLCPLSSPIPKSLIQFHISLFTIYTFSHLTPSNPPLPRPSRDPESHNFAFSSTVPILSLSLYFFKTLSLWYFQNCFVASLPATLLRIFEPPGCSSTNPISSLSALSFALICWIAVGMEGKEETVGGLGEGGKGRETNQ
jgi:hypothetical protein